jgi:hypothetical protein
MRSFCATRSNPSYSTQTHPALSSVADECCVTLARLLAYVGTLALLAMFGIHFWDQLPTGEASEPFRQAGWTLASRSYPAFAVSQFDSPEKTETYQIFRHPEGGRKDIFRRTARDGGQDEKALAELEIYRPGAKFDRSGPAAAGIAARMNAGGRHELEVAGLVDSKFGAVTLLRAAGAADGPQSCLGFIKRLDQPSLQISGWSCLGDALPARRAAIGCMLNRLILLTAGNEPKLGELFARAELRRESCGTPGPQATSADWVTGAGNPRLRGSL